MALPSAMITTKNKYLHDEVFMILLKVEFTGNTLYLANDNQDQVWNGHTWSKTQIGMEAIDLSATGTLPIFNVMIQNVDRMLAPYLDESSGGQGTKITLYVVDSSNLAETTPYMTVALWVVGCEETVGAPGEADWVSFKLGMRNPMIRAFPYFRAMKMYCRYKFFDNVNGGPLCKYVGPETSCDRHYLTCDSLGNALRFGGFPSLGQGGIYA